MVKKILIGTVWSLLWLVFFWAFLVSGFPNETAKGWLAERVGKGLNATVSIERLDIGWNLNLRLKGIAIDSRQSAVGSQESLQTSGFSIKLASLYVEPRLFSLIKFKPEIDFSGDMPSGGDFSGFYGPKELSAAFKDISFKDISIATIPVPSAASMSGSGNMKRVKGNGAIEVELDGIPGGKQRLKAPGGETSGLEGKIKIMVNLPRL